MQAAIAGSGWNDSAIEYVCLGKITTIIGADKNVMNILADPEILHITSADMLTWGFLKAMMECGLQPGNFHIAGLGNMESWEGYSAGNA